MCIYILSLLWWGSMKICFLRPNKFHFFDICKPYFQSLETELFAGILGFTGCMFLVSYDLGELQWAFYTSLAASCYNIIQVQNNCLFFSVLWVSNEVQYIKVDELKYIHWFQMLFSTAHSIFKFGKFRYSI